MWIVGGRMVGGVANVRNEGDVVDMVRVGGAGHIEEVSNKVVWVIWVITTTRYRQSMNPLL